ncbi:hypothetical protein Q6346_12955 [Isoptericola sp. b490]|uniref:hypothetical protein n=1 Tax=Actinotalea lenta TaxID=3064654 RepID=UPI002712F57A|nr:hypothetical protein [Isoptericola sp. b490]MDO8122219.1 hypothetical protein [Isoptericola sp. b490]
MTETAARSPADRPLTRRELRELERRRAATDASPGSGDPGPASTAPAADSAGPQPPTAAAPSRRQLRQHDVHVETAAPSDVRVVEPAAVTDGFGMPGTLMDAPVLPALRPIEEIEAELTQPARPDHAAVPGPRAVVPGPRAAVPGAVAPGSHAAAPGAVAPGSHAALPDPRAVVPGPRAALTGPRAVTVASAVVVPAVGWQPAASAPLPTPPATARPATRPAPEGARTAPPHPVDVLSRPPGRWQAAYGAWIGIAAVLVWVLGPVALFLGGWSYLQARREGFGLGRPLTALVGGVLGTALGVIFLLVSG